MTSKLTSKIPTRAGLLRHSVAWFLGALVLMFVTAPFIEELPNGNLIEAALLTVVLGTAVLAVGGRRRTLLLASVLVAPVVVARWLHHFGLRDGTYSFHIAAFLVFIAFVVFHFLRFILRSPRVNSEVLCAAVATYLLLGLLWAAAYASGGAADSWLFLWCRGRQSALARIRRVVFQPDHAHHRWLRGHCARVGPGADAGHVGGGHRHHVHGGAGRPAGIGLCL